MVDAASLGARHGASLLTQLKTERPSDIIKTRFRNDSTRIRQELFHIK